ncbi:phosphate metabolism protein 7 [Coemansia javaensis]|uniref:Phosphate metabolism protein 7 n=1 Tax=Coemansia javaensis TaxID=2761396 RepID=A0A9W8LM46_9FUNG|nr:phosphate metabolism protein 7 [Coemansia javaensis]
MIRQSGLDAYMFLRSVRTMFIMFSAIGVVSSMSILPANILGGGGQGGLNSLSMGNVNPKSNLLWVHMGVFALTIVWSIWCLVGELRIYAHLRMWWLADPENNAGRVGALTVLVPNLPAGLVRDEQRLRTLFDSMFPGGVRAIFVNRDSRELDKTVRRRDSLARKLEAALTAYAVRCTREWARSGASYASPLPPRPAAPRWRQHQRSGDLFEHYASEIAMCNHFIARSGRALDAMERRPSALVMFNRQIAAHMAAQCVLDHRPFAMAPVSTNVSAADIIWRNLHIGPWSRRIRGYVSFAASMALIVAWTVVSAFLSGLVQAGSLAGLDAFAWLRKRRLLLAVFSGTVPSLVLALLMSVLPRLLKLLLLLEGTVRRSEIELRVLHRYYFFQVWNVYLVTIFSSSMVPIAAQSVREPGKIVRLVQSQVPQSATNILTYVLLLAFVGAAKEVLQLAPLATRYASAGWSLLARTPRALRSAECPREFDWAAAIPTHSLIFLMGISYSFIAPIINGFVAVYFGLFYLIYRYQFLYVYDTSRWATGGLSFPKAVKQMLVAVYIAEVYMLLMMVASVSKSPSPIARVVVAALLIVLTVGAHLYINDACMPSIHHLPIKRAADIERCPLLAREFPNVLGEHDDSSADAGALHGTAGEWERRQRSRFYAMYSSLVPVCAIDLVLRAFPCLLRAPAPVEVARQDNVDKDAHQLKEEEEKEEEKRCSALESEPEDCRDVQARSEAELVREFAADSIRAKPVCNLWVPLGNSSLFGDLVREIEHHGRGTILVITEGTTITPRPDVQVDPDFEIERAEVRDKNELAAARRSRPVHHT